MSGSARDVWIWQEIVSPHMAALAVALARRGRKTVYVAERMSSTVGDRASQGWGSYDMGEVDFRLAGDPDSASRLAMDAGSQSVHICESIRARGSAGVAQANLARRGMRQWAIMEMVQDRGWSGPAKRLLYRARVLAIRRRIQGVLAIGHGVPQWMADRGFPSGRIFPFTYFLDDANAPDSAPAEGGFRIVFAGQLIERKRADLLIRAIARLGRPEVQLTMIGTGPLEGPLRDLAERLLPGRVQWTGRLPFTSVPGVIARADCLVLPSLFDGWGAVVSEGLMRGTPAICSSRCGARIAVEASGTGGVFESGSLDSLTAILDRQVRAGPVTGAVRARIAAWAGCLGATQGAEYLERILDHSDGSCPRPIPPWEASGPAIPG